MLVDRAVVRAALPGYALDRELGRGAFALVIAGRDRLGRAVAIKAMPRWPGSGAPDDAGLAGAAEARLLAGLDHPHVVRVFDFVERDGLALIVMELLGAGSLRGLGGGTLPAQAACGLGLAVADALHHAHERGVLHRDVKPSNLLMAADGTVKVADFGIAKAFAGSAVAASRTVGTPRYMAPEQFTLGPLRPSTDLYALGVVLYELLAGRHPLSPDTTTYEGYRQAHLEATPAPLPAGVPGPVVAVVERMLGKDPNARFPDGHACALALADAAGRAFGSDWLASCGYPVWVDGAGAASPARAAGLGSVPGPVSPANPVGPANAAGPANGVGRASAGAGGGGCEVGERGGADERGPDGLDTDGVDLAERSAQSTITKLAPQPAPGHRWRARSPRWPRSRRGIVAGLLAAVAATAVAVPLTVTGDRPSRAPEKPAALEVGSQAGRAGAPEAASPADVARRVAAAADAARGQHPDLARRLALAAYRISPVPEAATSVLASVPLTPTGPVLTGHTAGVNAVAFSPDGQLLASASVDHTVRLWDVADPARATPVGGPLLGHGAGLAALAFSPDGGTLASGGDDGSVRLWDVRDPTRAGGAARLPAGGPEPEPRATPVRALAFRPDGQLLAAGGNDQAIRIWDVRAPASPVPVGQPLVGHRGAVTGVAFSPDGHTLASAGADATVRLWDLRDLGAIARLGGPLEHPDQVTAVAFDRSGRVLASAAGPDTRLWDVHDLVHPRRLGRVLVGPTALLAAVTFDPTGPLLAAASYDTTVWLWNVRDPDDAAPVGTLAGGHTGAVRASVFSPTAAILATGSTDRTIRLWDLDPGHASRRLCATPAAVLSQADWGAYIPEIPYRPACG